jgi:hypothetical protein
MDAQVDYVRKDLQNHFGSAEWHLNLRAGPECILILAECLLLVSKPEAMALDLTGLGLPYVLVSMPHPLLPVNGKKHLAEIQR